MDARDEAVYTPISDLDNSKTDWIILVKINCKWKALRPGIASADANLDCVAIDKFGHQIHVEIDPELIPAYEDIIEEGKIYEISKFHVILTTRFEPVTRAVKIEFMEGTNVVEFSGIAPYIPDHNFEFCDFDDVPNHASDDDYLIDLVGILHTIREPEFTRTRFGNTSKTTLALRNLEEKLMNVTLWAKASEDFTNLHLGSATNTVVLILTSMAVKQFQGIYRTSSTAATKIYVNLDHPVVTQFLNSLQGPEEKPQVLPPEQFHRYRNGATEPQLVVTLSEIFNMPRNSLRARQFRILATLLEFDLTNGWYYDGCPSCTRRIKERFIRVACQGCGAKDVYATPCYKIEARMSDGTETCAFIFFTYVAEQLIGKPIDNIRLAEPTTRRRIPPTIAKLINTDYELQVAVNNKSLTLPRLIFNVNKVLKQHSTPSSSPPPTNQLHLAASPFSSNSTPHCATSVDNATLANNKRKRQLIEDEFDSPRKRPKIDSQLQEQVDIFSKLPLIEEIEPSFSSKDEDELTHSTTTSHFTVEIPKGTRRLIAPARPNVDEIKATPGNLILANVARRTRSITKALTQVETRSRVPRKIRSDMDFWNDLKGVGYLDEEIEKVKELDKGKEKVDYDSDEYLTPRNEPYDSASP